ncbi:hypothetical protein AYI69_g4668 [Smittium culicis]|uniref:Uncharacterized protein n=1 Tax=Smittium culicis TaxID=133412 RepID=A0A1R1YBN3_9FUNG|nr:hypothetical protein AYI69_g4668 [Smittium culicis]
MVATRHISTRRRVLALLIYVIVMVAAHRGVGATDQADGEQKEGERVTKPNVSGLRVVNLGGGGGGSGDTSSGDSGVLVKTFMMIGGGNSTFLKGVHDMKNKVNTTVVSGKFHEANKKASGNSSSSSGTSLGAQSESMLSFSFVVFTVTAVILSCI